MGGGCRVGEGSDGGSDESIKEVESNKDGPQGDIAMAFTGVDGGPQKREGSNCYFFVAKEEKSKKNTIDKLNERKNEWK